MEKVERLTDFNRFQKIEDGWNELLSSSMQDCIFLTHQWFSSWWKCLSQGKFMEILLVKDQRGLLIGIAPLMRESDRLSFMASQEVTDYCDFIVRRGKEEEFYKFY